MQIWFAKLASLFSGQKPADRELTDEMQAHIDFEIDENLRAGMPMAEARAAALRKFGNRTLARERARESWRFAWLDMLVQDGRYALRGLRKSPLSAAVLIATLALGIGANTAIFSVVNCVLLNPLPYPHSARLMWLGESYPKAEGIAVSWLNYRSWLAGNHTFEQMAGFDFVHFTLTGRGEPVFTRALRVTEAFFDLLGTRPLLGRLFSPDDDKPGAEPCAVLSYEFWASRLGGDPAIVGSTLALDGKAYLVLGVAAPQYHFFGPADLYVPLGPVNARIASRGQHGSMHVLARLRPGATLAEAARDLDGIMQRLSVEDPGPESTHRSYAEFLIDHVTQGSRPALLILMAAATLVLLIACANVANLLLARGSARLHEISVRAALGAGAGRITRQLLTESLVVVAIGGGAGLLLAYWCMRALTSSPPPGVPRLAGAALDWHVLLFALAITFFTGLIAGAAPAIHAARQGFAPGLHQGTRTSTEARSRQAWRGALVSAQIALTMTLAFASGLLLRSLAAAQNRDPGFRAQNLLELEMVLPSSRYHDQLSRMRFYDDLQTNLRALPGVAGVGIVNCPPTAGDCGDWFYSIPGKPVPSQGEVPIALFNVAGPDYFRTMQIPIVDGRPFSVRDTAPEPRLAIVNQVFARKWWPNETAVGKQIKFGGPYRPGPLYQIVGVARNVGQWGLDSEVYPEVYTSSTQDVSSGMTVLVRTASSPEPLIPLVRRCVTALDRDLAIRRLRSMDRVLAATLGQRRFSTLLLGVFAGLAILLAAVGTYGVLSYWVASRETEIAVRVAVGASRPAVVGLVASHAFRLAAWGVAAGLLGAWAASRGLAHMLFGVSAHNATATAAALGVVAFVAAAGAILPAWRAARLDPALKLHRA